jgi:hypothetical protein
MVMMAAAVLVAASTNVQAQTDLTAYADANGYIDVQALTCAALAGTWQGDADSLVQWLVQRPRAEALLQYPRSKELKHEVIVY